MSRSYVFYDADADIPILNKLDGYKSLPMDMNVFKREEERKKTRFNPFDQEEDDDSSTDEEGEVTTTCINSLEKEEENNNFKIPINVLDEKESNYQNDNLHLDTTTPSEEERVDKLVEVNYIEPKIATVDDRYWYQTQINKEVKEVKSCCDPVDVSCSIEPSVSVIDYNSYPYHYRNDEEVREVKSCCDPVDVSSIEPKIIRVDNLYYPHLYENGSQITTVNGSYYHHLCQNGSQITTANNLDYYPYEKGEGITCIEPTVTDREEEEVTNSSYVNHLKEEEAILSKSSSTLSLSNLQFTEQPNKAEVENIFGESSDSSSLSRKLDKESISKIINYLYQIDEVLLEDNSTFSKDVKRIINDLENLLLLPEAVLEIQVIDDLTSLLYINVMKEKEILQTISQKIMDIIDKKEEVKEEKEEQELKETSDRWCTIC